MLKIGSLHLPWIFCILFAASPNNDAFSQILQLKGSVMDSEGGSPLEGANIDLYLNDSLVSSSTSDSLGRYISSCDISAGEYTVVYTMNDGYHRKELLINTNSIPMDNLGILGKGLSLEPMNVELVSYSRIPENKSFVFESPAGYLEYNPKTTYIEVDGNSINEFSSRVSKYELINSARNNEILFWRRPYRSDGYSEINAFIDSLSKSNLDSVTSLRFSLNCSTAGLDSINLLGLKKCRFQGVRSLVIEFWDELDVDGLEKLLAHINIGDSIQLIKISHCKGLKEVPQKLLNYKTLLSVHVVATPVSEIVIGQDAVNLVELEVVNTLISDFPRIQHCKNLELLNLGNIVGRDGYDAFGNQISSVPVWISQLSELRVLNLSNLSLSSFPEPLLKNEKLVKLYFDNYGCAHRFGTCNRIRSVPQNIVALSRLRILGLINNGFRSIPNELINMTNLEEVYFVEGPIERNNDFSFVPELADSISPDKARKFQHFRMFHTRQAPLNYSGVWYRFYENGSLRTFSNERWRAAGDSILHYQTDKYFEFHENGQTKSLISFDSVGNYHGKYTIFYETGDTSSHGTYDHGKEIGQHLSFYQDGQVAVIDDYDLDYQLKYHENGILKSKTYYENGLTHGPYLEQYASGKTLARGNYINGFQAGKYTWFHENGNISTETWFDKKGRGFILKSYVYFESGSIKIVAKRKRGILHYKVFDEDKNLVALEYTLDDGSPIGEWQYYEGDSITKTEYYTSIVVVDSAYESNASQKLQPATKSIIGIEHVEGYEITVHCSGCASFDLYDSNKDMSYYYVLPGGQEIVIWANGIDEAGQSKQVGYRKFKVGLE